LICIVTDRQRRDVLAQVRDAAQAGVDLVQIRERDLEAAALAALVRQAVALTRGSATRIIVNDRLDVALACGADGVHLRGDSFPAAAARRGAPPGFFVGRSVHSADDARAAGRDVDYVIAGTLFPTTSKLAAHRLLGLDGLRAVVAAAGAPVLAIGGVTAERLGEIAATGAAGVAASGLFTGAASLAQTVDLVRRRFDSVKTRS
jgi:thiamine-phosphate pyrophosphorylase